MYFPHSRSRRLRQNPILRRMVRETDFAPSDLIYPLFVRPGEGIRAEIKSLPGLHHFSIDTLVQEAREVEELGLPAILLFGLPERKDERGSEACAEDGIVQRAVRALKEATSDLLIITDVCLCEYTEHGHCGLVNEGEIANDPSVELLAQVALSHVRAGADMVAPSDMMDGRVRAIREALDSEGFSHTPILSYAAKYHSSFYGPFRHAADSAPEFGDRSSYQMDVGNAREALDEVRKDIQEGADIVMVKPALPCLDIIWRVRQAFDVPIAAYSVSGEYTMVATAAEAGYLDRDRAILECIFAIKRAGADIICTYFAKELVRRLEGFGP